VIGIKPVQAGHAAGLLFVHSADQEAAATIDFAVIESRARILRLHLHHQIGPTGIEIEGEYTIAECNNGAASFA
jgi:hypothetical protein